MFGSSTKFSRWFSVRGTQFQWNELDKAIAEADRFGVKVTVHYDANLRKPSHTLVR